MDRNRELYTVNMLKPKNGQMQEEVLIIITALFGWAAMTFGFQLFVWLFSQSSPATGPAKSFPPFQSSLPLLVHSSVSTPLVHHHLRNFQPLHRPAHRASQPQEGQDL